MQGTPSLPHGPWYESWPQWLITFALASSGWIKVWFDSRKSSADIHLTDAGTAKTHAETRKINLENSADLGEIVTALASKILEAQERGDEQRNRWDEARTRLLAQNDVLQGQLSDKDRQEQAARARTHRAIAEIERCVFAIRAYEETLKENKVHCIAFEVKSYEEIMGVDLR